MSAMNHREQEAKFQVSPAQETLLAAPALAQEGYTAQPLGTFTHIDTYFDTPDFGLLRHGLALRMRRSDNACEIGIKSITATRKRAILSRMDIAVPLPEDADPYDHSAWPAAIKEQLEAAAVKPKHLRPVLVVEQTRVKWRVAPATHATWAAEWSLDKVWIKPESHDENHERHTNPALMHNGNSSGDHPDTPSFELEIELLPRPEGETADASKAATAPDFPALVELVQDRFQLAPLHTSKFLRGLAQRGALLHDQAAAITPDMSLGDAGRLLVYQQFVQMAAQEGGVRAGKVAAVHDMRVAMRRARAALHLCEDWIPARELERLHKGFRRLGRKLGIVRDLDVARANLRAFARSQPEPVQSGIKRLRDELKQQRGDALAHLVALLDTKKHRKFVRRLVTFCTTPAAAPGDDEDAGVEIAPTHVRHTLPSRILAAFEAVRAYEVALTGPVPPRFETLHALRIRAKYLRYLIEFSQHMMGEDGARFARRLRTLQDHLGDLNDAHMEEVRLRHWPLAHVDEDLRAAIATRRSLLAARIHELASTVPLADFTSLAARRTLANALAHM